MRLDVWRDRATSAGPIVITLHGRLRTRADMEPIAKLLAQRGAIVFNADYRGSAEVERGYPASFEDVACAVRFTRAHAADYGGDPGRRVVLVGHSFGTYVGSIVALDGDEYNNHCVSPEESAEPDAFVGLSGAYHWHTTPIWNTFFGTTYAKDPERWKDGDPHTHIGGNPDSLWRFVIEKSDPILEASSSEEFHEALVDAGYDSKLRQLKKAGHFTILQLDGDAPTAAEIIAVLAGLPSE
jgi:acetyl esterase/lipase